MLMGLAALALLISVPATGGSLRRLVQLPVRAVWLLPVALFLQVLVINVVPGVPEPIPVGVHLITYALAGVFLTLNRSITGLPLIAFGGAMNGITIAVNGGSLPASADALRRAGWAVDSEGFTNSTVMAHPHLAWLGDNFAVPAAFPFANVYSAGDILILLGALVVLHVNSRPGSATTGFPNITFRDRAGADSPISPRGPRRLPSSPSGDHDGARTDRTAPFTRSRSAPVSVARRREARNAPSIPGADHD